MGTDRKTILLIDDEIGFHELFRYLIEPLGIQLQSAFNGVEGLECSSKKDYVVIFLDMHMPKMVGTEVLKRIHAMKPRQPVVMLSSNSDPTHVLEQQARQIGIEAFLEKPFEADRVLAIIAKLTGLIAKPPTP